MSQTSTSSDFSFTTDLSLSQGTMNHLLGSVGMEAGAGNILTDCYSVAYDDDEEGDITILEEGGSSSLCVRKAVFTQSDQPLMWSDCEFSGTVTSTSCSKSPPAHHPYANSFSPLCQPSSSGLMDTSSGLMDETSLLTPASAHNPMACSPQLCPQMSPPLTPGVGGSGGGGASFPVCTRPTIPLNTPVAGKYRFKVMDSELEGRRLNSAHFIYSPARRRAYIKQGVAIPFYFTITGTPPPDCVLRAMCIHSAPESIAENLVCCPKHVNLNQKKGLLQPAYFIRPAPNNTTSSFRREESNSRLSIVTPLNALQRNHEKTCYTAIYMFPCHTSDFSKTGQYVQVIFTLEQEAEVLGRTTIDIRVCASPRRDCDVDDGKSGSSSVVPNQDEPSVPPEFKNGRKRANPAAQVEVTRCVGPPKRVCQGFSKHKVKHVIWTYPEVVPYVDVCVKMMEKVHRIPTTVDAQTTNFQTQNSTLHQPIFESLESWLEHLDLRKYQKILQNNGISDTTQVLTITDEELKSWGMKMQSHRKKFLDGKGLIIPYESDSQGGDTQDADENSLVLTQSPPSTSTLPPNSPPNPPVSMSHQNSNPPVSLSHQNSNPPVSMSHQNSNPPVSMSHQNSKVLAHTQSFEVFEITMTKSLSSSSSCSTSSFR